MIYFQSFPVLHLGAMAESLIIIVGCRVECNYGKLKPNLKLKLKLLLRKSALSAAICAEVCNKRVVLFDHDSMTRVVTTKSPMIVSY